MDSLSGDFGDSDELLPLEAQLCSATTQKSMPSCLILGEAEQTPEVDNQLPTGKTISPSRKSCGSDSPWGLSKGINKGSGRTSSSIPSQHHWSWSGQKDSVKLLIPGGGSALSSHTHSFHRTSSRTWVLRGILGLQFSS